MVFFSRYRQQNPRENVKLKLERQNLVVNGQNNSAVTGKHVLIPEPIVRQHVINKARDHGTVTDNNKANCKLDHNHQN